MEIYQLSATDLAKKIKSKEVSSKELTQMYIDRIEKLDGDINSVVIRMFERAIQDAEKADIALSKGEDLGPLHGIPMTIKESYAIEDQKTTWGNEAFKENTAKSDGLAVRRFREAGAHFMGKTNVPLDLADFQSFNSIYGTTNNPWNLERIPGGSSGGSAAALADGFTGLEASSDIQGSIRAPAQYCEVCGNKPRHRIIPQPGKELISNVIEGKNKPSLLNVSEGTLILFYGRDYLHRVTPVLSDTPRILITLNYNEENHIELSENARLTFFGRTE